MFFKRVVSSFLAVAAVFSLFACLGTTASAASVKIADGNYYITNVKTGNRLALQSNSDKDGASLITDEADSLAVAQVMRVKNSGNNIYIYPAESTTRNFAATDTKSGAKISLSAADGSTAEKFVLSKNSDGTYTIQSAANTKLLLTEANKAVTLNTQNTKDPNTQRWTIEKFILKGAGTDPDGKLPYGIDVSEHQSWQKPINWEAVKAYGVEFAIIRLGYGDDMKSQDDAAFAYNVAECKRLGIPFGVYIYSYAETTRQARSEAAHCIRLLKGINLSYPVYYDLEDPDTTAKCTNAEILAIAKAFEKDVTAAGYQVGFYANTYWWTTKLTDNYYNGFSRWVAQYNDECTYEGAKDMWQYSSEGKIAGIYGDVDMNVLYGLMPKYTYNGKAITPKLAVECDGKTLKEGVDYKISYQNNTNAGIATFTATGIGDYSGKTFKKSFIILPRDIEKASTSASVRVSGKKLTTTVKSTYGGKTLKNGTDYTYSVKAGKNNEYATVTVSGKGNFCGSEQFLVMPKKLSGVKISDITTKKLTISWSKISTASKYRIYRATENDGDYKYLASTKSCTYTDTTVKSGTHYSYRVRAFKSVDGKLYFSDYSSVAKTNTKIGNTSFTLKRNAANDTVTVNIKKISGVTGYDVFQKNESGKYKRIGSTKGTSYVVKNCLPSKTYSFKIRTYKSTASGTIYGTTTAAKAVTMAAMPNTDFKLKRSAKNDNVTVNITPVKNVTGYVIYQMNESGKYKKIGSTTGASYVVKNCLPSKTYSFKIRTYKKTGAGTVYGIKSAAKSTTMAAMPNTDFKLKRSAKNDTVTVNITPVKNVTGYVIYQMNESGKYKKIGSTTGASYVVKNCLPSKTYSFKIRTYKKTGAGTVYGIKSAAKSTTMAALAVPDFTAKYSAKAATVTVTITPEKNITGYMVYQKKSGKYKKVYKGTQPQFILKNAQKGKSYSFLVRTYKTGEYGTVYGKKSEAKSVKS